MALYIYKIQTHTYWGCMVYVPFAITVCSETTLRGRMHSGACRLLDKLVTIEARWQQRMGQEALAIHTRCPAGNATNQESTQFLGRNLIHSHPCPWGIKGFPHLLFFHFFVSFLPANAVSITQTVARASAFAIRTKANFQE